MADTIKIPGVGTVPKKYALVGGGVVVVIVGVAYYRHRNAPQAPADAVPAAPTDGAYTDPTAGSTVPSGYLGDSGYYPSGGTPYAPYGYDIYGNPIPAPTGLGTSSGVYTTNVDWANAAESQLEQTGVSLTVSGTAISKVLAGLTVTADQKNIFLEAVGLLGQPPQGYPTPIKLADPATTPPTTSGSSLPAPGGLHAATVGKTTVRIEWNAVPGAKGYAVYDVADPAGGGTPTGVRQQSVVYTNYNKAGLKPNTRYRFDVHALGADNKLGARARIYVTTKK